MGRWSELVRTWGTSPEERQGEFPCDKVLPEFSRAYYRGVTIDASPGVVFRWLCQLRVATYSYDWISHFARGSPHQLTPGLEELQVGQTVMNSFELVEFDRDRHITLGLRKAGTYPPLAVSYVIVPAGADRCRLLVKLVIRFRGSLYDRLAEVVAPWLDCVMMRRQLLNLKTLSERTAQRP